MDLDRQFGHPSSQSLLDSVAEVFKKKVIFAKNDRHIVFVCGGNDKRKKRAVRTLFLGYAKRCLRHFRVFLAENAAKDLLSHSKPRFLNVAQFEDLIAEVADCVLIFPESPGSVAELAYFSRDPRIRDKILVVNDARLQAEDSFLNMGPLALISDTSIFRPTIQIDYRDPKFTLVKKRLARHFPSHNRDRVDYSDHDKLTARDKFYAVYEIVRIFGAINLNGVAKCMEVIFGAANVDDLSRYLSILIAADYIVRKGAGRQYFSPKSGVSSFLEYEHFSTNGLMAHAASYYKENEPEVFKLLQGVVR